MGKARDLSRAHRLCTTCQVPSPASLTCSAAVARAPSCPAKNSGPVLPQGLCMGFPLAWSAVWLPLPPPPGLCSMHMTQRRPPDLPFYKDGPSLSTALQHFLRYAHLPQDSISGFVFLPTSSTGIPQDQAFFLFSFYNHTPGIQSWRWQPFL